jgi:EAL domain-containing protein (putative c-di-GMP-specific phosphodiesterase class I)
MKSNDESRVRIAIKESLERLKYNITELSTECRNDYVWARYLDKGCEIFQGFYFGRPVPAEEFTAFIKNTMASIEIKKHKLKV